MEIRSRILGGALLSTLVVTSAVAAVDPLSVAGSVGAGWQSFVSPNEDGVPFWDVPSADGSGYNVGYFLTGTGGYSSNANSPRLDPSKLTYWGYSSGLADLAVTLSTLLNVSANLKIEVAGLAGQNSVGYYTGNSLSSFTTLFNGSSVIGSTTSFTPNGSFGLAIKTPVRSSSNPDIFASQANLNTDSSVRNNQDVAIFKYVNGATTTFYVGFEDTPYTTLGEYTSSSHNIGDFNDVILQLSVQTVPEAGTWAAIGAVVGIAALQGYRIHRKRA
ncbi:MAG TPA: hypothetical protein VMF06_04080 [Candidatus Limnocylindria bacterium]|jgi:hypothetical protein|nr:hypothetical protein [Candidatus Limnocylindria bacterium]